MRDRERLRRALACASDVITVELGDIEVLGRSSIAGKLDSGASSVKQRAELIKAVRAGEHAELLVTARTFRQKLGSPNSRFLRHNDQHLPDLAASYKGQPFLLDHRSWDQEARMGTIVDSVVHDHGGTGWKSFDQKLQAVKPHAVISFLDGTLDRFSIGWNRGEGDVICSAHGTSVFGRGACGCWPGDTVSIDGKDQTVEFEFQRARGTETSGVNSPAVFSGTGVKDIRAALCEELGLTDRDFEPENHNQENQMQFTRLAALLGLTTLSSSADEDRALTAIENIKRERATAEQERDAAKTKLSATEERAKKAEQSLLTANETALKAQVDSVLEGAYREGKLRRGRDENGLATASSKEPRLRRIAKEDGIEALRAELSEMDVVVPVGQRALTDATPEPKRSPTVLVGAPPKEVLQATADELGLKVEDLEAHYQTQEG